MNDQNNPLSPEDIEYWKAQLDKADKATSRPLTLMMLLEDFWSRDFPMEEAFAICLIRWPQTSLEVVKILYERMDKEFHEDMIAMLERDLNEPSTLTLNKEI